MTFETKEYLDQYIHQMNNISMSLSYYLIDFRNKINKKLCMINRHYECQNKYKEKTIFKNRKSKWKIH